jgi:hypothetical protein
MRLGRGWTLAMRGLIDMPPSCSCSAGDSGDFSACWQHFLCWLWLKYDQRRAERYPVAVGFVQYLSIESSSLVVLVKLFRKSSHGVVD